MKKDRIKDRIEKKIEVHSFISSDTFEGEIDKIIEALKSIPERLKEAYPLNEEFKAAHRFSIRSDTEYDMYSNDSHDVYILQCFRWETDEEMKTRLEQAANRSIAAKKAAKTKEDAKAKREKTLYENLKKKFENQSV